MKPPTSSPSKRTLSRRLLESGKGVVWVAFVVLIVGISEGWSWDVLMVGVCGVGLVAAAGLGAALGAWVVPEVDSFVGFALAVAGAAVLDVVG